MLFKTDVHQLPVCAHAVDAKVLVCSITPQDL